MAEWRLYEVFVRSKHGLNHKHVGSVHASDNGMAMENARDLYTRRSEGVSIWVVPSDTITASASDEKDVLFDPAEDKVYRHASFYKLPDEIGHM
jgi:ring-1,2-phenylacetyl-CoA epoxidase subunit PaaB